MFLFFGMELDVKDKKILQELDANPKIPLSRLAKKVRLSQQVVDYRIKRLREQGIIQHFGTIFNLSKIGYEQYRVFFQVGNVDDNEKRRVIEYLKKHENLYWAALVGGKWDLLVVVFVKNYEEFESFLDELFEKYQKILKDYEAFYVLYHEFYSHKFLGDIASGKPLKINFANAGAFVDLDTLDIKILDLIKMNCRAPSLDIGKKCKVSYKTIQNRIKVLDEKGLIAGYRLFLRSEQFFYKAYFLVVSFTSYGRKTQDDLLGYAQQHPLITQTLKLFGRWSLMFHLRLRDERELQGVIIEMRNKFPLIGDYGVIPVFEDIAIAHFPMSKKL